jgi:hypothetical protein
MIYTSLCVMFLMRADTLRGQVGLGWALEFWSFLGPKWHSPVCSMPFHRARINHMCINSYFSMPAYLE